MNALQERSEGKVEKGEQENHVYVETKDSLAKNLTTIRLVKDKGERWYFENGSSRLIMHNMKSLINLHPTKLDRVMFDNGEVEEV